MASGSDQDAALRMLQDQRATKGRQDPQSQLTAKSGLSDSAALSLHQDSLLAAPTIEEEEYSYRISIDTVSVDSLKDPTITQKIGFTDDGKHMLVKRKSRIFNNSALERFEIAFFRKAPASLFGSTTNAVNGDYPIKAGDALVLTLWGEVEKEQTLKVSNQGSVTVEGVGMVSINNMTLAEAEGALKGKLSKIYSGISGKRTFVNLRLESLSGIKVFVLGDATKPGGYVFYGNTSILQALYLAGGPSKIGSVRNIQVTRGDTTFTVDLYQYLIQGKKPEPSILLDGDILFLPRADILAGVSGDVGRPAVYEAKKGETVKDLLTFASRTNATAAHTISLWRIMDDGRSDVMDLDSAKAYATGGAAFPLQNGDSLVVRVSTKVSREFVEVQGSVWYPGRYAWKSGMTVADAIPLSGGLRPEAYAERVIIRRPMPDSSYSYLSEALSAPKQSLLPQDQLVVLNSAALKAPQPVYVEGAVKKPTTVAWQQGITVKTLIAMANGFLLNHQRGVVRIERLIPGKDETQILSLTITDDLKVGSGDDPVVEPGDRVVVPADPNFYVQEIVTITGAVRNQGSYSLNRTREPFGEFMKRVAKLDQNAFTQGGRLFRKRGTEIYQVNFDMKAALAGGYGSDITLQGGDSIDIPMEQLTVRVTGEVVSPGDVLWDKGQGIEDFIDAAGGYTINGDERRVIITYADGRKSTMNRADRDPDPGSVIFVPYMKEPEPTNWYQVVAAVTSTITAFAGVWMTWAIVTGKIK